MKIRDSFRKKKKNKAAEELLPVGTSSANKKPRYGATFQLPHTIDIIASEDEESLVKSAGSVSETTHMISEDSRRKRGGGDLSRTLAQSVKQTFTPFTEGLAMTEENNVRQVSVFCLMYLAMGIVAYSYVFEKWSVIDSAYFTIVTFCTVGYGDLDPSTDAGRAFCIFYALVGITALGILLGYLGSYVMKNHEETINSASMRFLQGMEKDSNDVAEQQQGTFNKASDVKLPPSSLSAVITNETLKHLPLTLLMGACAVLIGYVEGWSFVESMYFLTITSTTTGYGDLYPKQPSMKLFSLIFIPLSVGTMGTILGTVAQGFMNIRASEEEAKLLDHRLNAKDLDLMDEDGDGEVSKGEFLAYMLVSMHKVDQETVDRVFVLFDNFDKTKNGKINQEDLDLATKNAESLR